MAGVVWQKVWTTRLTPAEAEVRVSVNLATEPPAGTDLAGRVLGPSCRYAETIEVAYPLRPLPAPGEAPTRRHARAIIPEPNWWSPETPFLYELRADLRDGGRRTEVVRLTHGLRSALLSPHEVRWNGQPMELRGRAVDRAAGERAAAVVAEARRDGRNLIVAPARWEGFPIWDAAEEHGCLVIGRFDGGDERHDQPVYAESYVNRFACAFGWLFPPETDAVEIETARTWLTMSAPYDPFLGLELDRAPAEPVPGPIDFVACRGDLLPSLAGLTLPKLVLGPPLAAPAVGVVGYVEGPGV